MSLAHHAADHRTGRVESGGTVHVHVTHEPFTIPQERQKRPGPHSVAPLEKKSAAGGSAAADCRGIPRRLVVGSRCPARHLEYPSVTRDGS